MHSATKWPTQTDTQYLNVAPKPCIPTDNALQPRPVPAWEGRRCSALEMATRPKRPRSNGVGFPWSAEAEAAARSACAPAAPSEWAAAAESAIAADELTWSSVATSGSSSSSSSSGGGGGGGAAEDARDGNGAALAAASDELHTILARGMVVACTSQQGLVVAGDDGASEECEALAGKVASASKAGCDLERALADAASGALAFVSGEARRQGQRESAWPATTAGGAPTPSTCHESAAIGAGIVLARVASAMDRADPLHLAAACVLAVASASTAPVWAGGIPTSSSATGEPGAEVMAVDQVREGDAAAASAWLGVVSAAVAAAEPFSPSAQDRPPSAVAAVSGSLLGAAAVAMCADPGPAMARAAARTSAALDVLSGPVLGSRPPPAAVALWASPGLAAAAAAAVASSRQGGPWAAALLAGLASERLAPTAIAAAASVLVASTEPVCDRPVAAEVVQHASLVLAGALTTKGNPLTLEGSPMQRAVVAAAAATLLEQSAGLRVAAAARAMVEAAGGAPANTPSEVCKALSAVAGTPSPLVAADAGVEGNIRLLAEALARADPGHLGRPAPPSPLVPGTLLSPGTAPRVERGIARASGDTLAGGAVGSAEADDTPLSGPPPHAFVLLVEAVSGAACAAAGEMAAASTADEAEALRRCLEVSVRSLSLASVALAVDLECAAQILWATPSPVPAAAPGGTAAARVRGVVAACRAVAALRGAADALTGSERRSLPGLAAAQSARFTAAASARDVACVARAAAAAAASVVTGADTTVPDGWAEDAAARVAIFSPTGHEG